MKFLVDHQLPPALAVALRDRGLDAEHLYDLGLHRLTDEAIWHRVGIERSILITKDEDFLHLASRSDTPARLLWVRLGNCRNAVLLPTIVSALDEIPMKFAAGDQIVELTN
jgi:predicted nuclease of predicted toxin-antitoxin system